MAPAARAGPSMRARTRGALLVLVLVRTGQLPTVSRSLDDVALPPLRDRRCRQLAPGKTAGEREKQSAAAAGAAAEQAVERVAVTSAEEVLVEPPRELMSVAVREEAAANGNPREWPASRGG